MKLEEIKHEYYWDIKYSETQLPKYSNVKHSDNQLLKLKNTHQLKGRDKECYFEYYHYH